LSNLTLQPNPGGDKTVKVSDVSIVSVSTSGHASGQGTLAKDVENNSFTLTLNKIDGGEGSYTVTYRYILDQEIPQELEEGQRRIYATGNNTAKAESGPIKHSDSDHFEIEKENKPVTIGKNGSYDANTNKITWTITLTLKNGNHDLTDEMFEDAGTGVQGMSKRVVIDVDGNKVVARCGDKEGFARCQPDDDFDFYTGAKLALERLEEAEKPYAWLKDGMEYYISDITTDNLYGPQIYSTDKWDKRYMERGIVFMTPEEAIACAKKMLAAVKQEG
jgi:hypothetical protein